jgi:poly(hydroxyalkanoate) granule-associated protein
VPSPTLHGQFLKPSAREVHHGQSYFEEKIDASTTALSDVKSYARKIWLAGLGAYAKVGQEGSDYFQELIKAGQTVEKKGKKAVTEKLEAANAEIDEAKGEVSTFKGQGRSSTRQGREGVRHACRKCLESYRHSV